MEIQQMLLSLRKNGHTEYAIAYACKIHQSTVSRILSGKIQDPRGSVVRAIKNLFEIESPPVVTFDS